MIKWFKGFENLECEMFIYHVRPARSCLESTGFTPHNTTVRNKFVRKASEFLKSFLVIPLSKSEIIVGITATELRNLNAMGIIGFQVAGAK